MPRHASRNLISMHDIIAQPLGALPDAVAAALRRPEPLAAAEVMGVWEHCAFVLLRASEALSCGDAAAFAALMRLLSEALTHSTAVYEQGMQVFVLQPSHLHTLRALFRRAIEQHAVPPHSEAAVELVHVISGVCDAEALKDACGEQFMAALVRVLQELYNTECEDDNDNDNDNDDATHTAAVVLPATTLSHVNMQRAVATALINLVRRSRANKQRAVSWRCVAQCCVRSVDVFFQLQCIELLVRVSRQRRDVLDAAAAVLPHATAQQLRALPNDDTLLQRMTTLVAQLNDGRDTVLRYELRDVTIAESALPSAHEVYFTPHYFVVLVAARDADHVTVPYDAIRSVTLGKDGRVVIRLDTFPLKLERLLSHVAGMDVVTLHMSLDTLQAFKQSAIRGWVTGVLHARKRATARPLTTTTIDAATTTDAAAAATAAPHDATDVANTTTPPPRAPTLQLAERTPPPRAAASPAVTAAMTAMTTHLHDDAARRGAGGLRLIDVATPAHVDAHERVQRTRPHDTDDNASDDRHRNGATTTATTAVSVPVSTTLPQMQKALAQLRRVRAAKHELRRARVADGLQTCMQRVQDAVEAARQQTRTLRTTWYDEANTALTRVEQLVADAHDVAAASVQQLNGDLQELKSSNHALNDRLSCAELELQQTLQTSRDRETHDLRELRALCERASTRLEQALGAALLQRDVFAPPQTALPV